MKRLIILEEFAKFAACYLATWWLGYTWWLFWVLIFLPDVSMMGYLVNTRIGAFTYNLVHHQAVAIIIGITGMVTDQDILLLAGIVLFGHSAMDRMFGYGLKYADSFQNTHLGKIGKEGLK